MTSLPSGSATSRKRLYLPFAESENATSSDSKRGKLNTAQNGSTLSKLSTGIDVSRVVPTSVSSLEQGMVIGEFRILGCGKRAKAICTEMDEVFDAMILTPSQNKQTQDVIARIQQAEVYYRGHSVEELSERMFPRKSRVMKWNDLYLLFTPARTKRLEAHVVDNRDTISELQVKEVFDQILRIVNFCHQCGILIGELHANKFVYEATNGKVYFSGLPDCTLLLDPHDDLIRQRYITPAFVSPEALVLSKGELYSAKCAEMWSLGVLLYNMLFGTYPFVDSTPRGVFQQIQNGALRFPRAHVSSEARMLLFTILRKNPEERPLAEHLVVTPYWQGPMTCPCKLKALEFGLPS